MKDLLVQNNLLSNSVRHADFRRCWSRIFLPPISSGRTHSAVSRSPFQSGSHIDLSVITFRMCLTKNYQDFDFKENSTLAAPDQTESIEAGRRTRNARIVCRPRGKTHVATMASEIARADSVVVPTLDLISCTTCCFAVTRSRLDRRRFYEIARHPSHLRVRFRSRDSPSFVWSFSDDGIICPGGDKYRRNSPSRRFAWSDRHARPRRRSELLLEDIVGTSSTASRLRACRDTAEYTVGESSQLTEKTVRYQKARIYINFVLQKNISLRT